ncbi:MAG: hypothetical protein EZS28_012873 [Streblomastix strix]|uniref:Uncharacterized protein n=1 Tax=Streblomastix strix TaxID=222440 RepID=A0A5J4WB57_9EUKA|nr:MAG: hypothetical protein EZS28_012873 [Streblomastix strix]
MLQWHFESSSCEGEMSQDSTSIKQSNQNEESQRTLKKLASISSNSPAFQVQSSGLQVDSESIIHPMPSLNRDDSWELESYDKLLECWVIIVSDPLYQFELDQFCISIFEYYLENRIRIAWHELDIGKVLWKDQGSKIRIERPNKGWKNSINTDIDNQSSETQGNGDDSAQLILRQQINQRHKMQELLTQFEQQQNSNFKEIEYVNEAIQWTVRLATEVITDEGEGEIHLIPLSMTALLPTPIIQQQSMNDTGSITSFGNISSSSSFDQPLLPTPVQQSSSSSSEVQDQKLQNLVEEVVNTLTQAVSKLQPYSSNEILSEYLPVLIPQETLTFLFRFIFRWMETYVAINPLLYSNVYENRNFSAALPQIVEQVQLFAPRSPQTETLLQIVLNSSLEVLSAYAVDDQVSSAVLNLMSHIAKNKYLRWCVCNSETSSWWQWARATLSNEYLQQSPQSSITSSDTSVFKKIFTSLSFANKARLIEIFLRSILGLEKEPGESTNEFGLALAQEEQRQHPQQKSFQSNPFQQSIQSNSFSSQSSLNRSNGFPSLKRIYETLSSIIGPLGEGLLNVLSINITLTTSNLGQILHKAVQIYTFLADYEQQLQINNVNIQQGIESASLIQPLIPASIIDETNQNQSQQQGSIFIHSSPQPFNIAYSLAHIDLLIENGIDPSPYIQSMNEHIIGCCSCRFQREQLISLQQQASSEFGSSNSSDQIQSFCPFSPDIAPSKHNGGLLSLTRVALASALQCIHIEQLSKQDGLKDRMLIWMALSFLKGFSSVNDEEILMPILMRFLLPQFRQLLVLFGGVYSMPLLLPISSQVFQRYANVDSNGQSCNTIQNSQINQNSSPFTFDILSLILSLASLPIPNYILQQINISNPTQQKPFFVGALDFPLFERLLLDLTQAGSGGEQSIKVLNDIYSSVSYSQLGQTNQQSLFNPFSTISPLITESPLTLAQRSSALLQDAVRQAQIQSQPGFPIKIHRPQGLLSVLQPLLPLLPITAPPIQIESLIDDTFDTISVFALSNESYHSRRDYHLMRSFSCDFVKLYIHALHWKVNQQQRIIPIQQQPQTLFLNQPTQTIHRFLTQKGKDQLAQGLTDLHLFAQRISIQSEKNSCLTDNGAFELNSFIQPQQTQGFLSQSVSNDIPPFMILLRPDLANSFIHHPSVQQSDQVSQQQQQDQVAYDGLGGFILSTQMSKQIADIFPVSLGGHSRASLETLVFLESELISSEQHLINETLAASSLGLENANDNSQGDNQQQGLLNHPDLALGFAQLFRSIITSVNVDQATYIHPLIMKAILTLITDTLFVSMDEQLRSIAYESVSHLASYFHHSPPPRLHSANTHKILQGLRHNQFGALLQDIVLTGVVRAFLTGPNPQLSIQHSSKAAWQLTLCFPEKMKVLIAYSISQISAALPEDLMQLAVAIRDNKSNDEIFANFEANISRIMDLIRKLMKMK